MLNENEILVSYKDPDKPDKILTGMDMIGFVAEFMQAQKQHELESKSIATAVETIESIRSKIRTKSARTAATGTMESVRSAWTAKTDYTPLGSQTPLESQTVIDTKTTPSPGGFIESSEYMQV